MFHWINVQFRLDFYKEMLIAKDVYMYIRNKYVISLYHWVGRTNFGYAIMNKEYKKKLNQ